MKKKKTKKLTGRALDWAVSEAECRAAGVHARAVTAPRYSTDWSLGGSIIERELIGTSSFNDNGEWIAIKRQPNCSTLDWGFGPTPLIAAMRCYVASTLGYEIDVPEQVAAA